MRLLSNLHVKGKPAVLPDRAIRSQSHYFIYRPRIVFTFDPCKNKICGSRYIQKRRIISENSELCAKKRPFSSLRISWHLEGLRKTDKLLAKFHAFTAVQFRSSLSFFFALRGLFVTDVSGHRVTTGSLRSGKL